MKKIVKIEQNLVNDDERQKATDIFYKSIVIDGCKGVALINDTSALEKMQKSGVIAPLVSVPRNHEANFRDAVNELIIHYDWIKSNAQRAMLATSTLMIRNAKREGKVAMVFVSQNAKLIEDDLSLLDILYQLGIRIIQLTYSGRNLIGDGSAERTNCGLSKFGVDVVEEMNRIGMVIDLSHCGDVTTLDAIEVSRDPVLFTHANPRSSCNNIRNKTDEQIQALSEKGGVIGLTANSFFCEIKKGVRPTIGDYITHIEYVANLVGVDYVGIGLDISEGLTKERYDSYRRTHPKLGYTYEFEEMFVNGMTSLNGYLRIAEGLVVRGFSNQEIEKILGGNLLRVFEKVWK